MKNSVNSLKAIIRLRSGGLPVVYRKKVIKDQIDLAIAMCNILYNFFKINSDASGDDLYYKYVFEIQSWGTVLDNLDNWTYKPPIGHFICPNPIILIGH